MSLLPRRALIALLCCGLAASSSSAEIIYVKAGATGVNDGTSWEDAFVHLQDALGIAGAADQVWVAIGIYKPDQGQSQTSGDRAASFELVAGLTLYGGFAGNEETLDERAGLFDETILSGDLADDDLPDFANRTDNSLHVIFAQTGSDTAFTVDGFRIIGGSATESPDHNMGGGAWVVHGAVEFRNCAFTENEAQNSGGAKIQGEWISVLATFESCRFENNRAVGTIGTAGAVGVGGEHGGGAFRSCVFRHNTAANGGAVHIGITTPSPPFLFENCVFEENTATWPDELFGGGAISAGSSY